MRVERRPCELKQQTLEEKTGMAKAQGAKPRFGSGSLPFREMGWLLLSSQH